MIIKGHIISAEEFGKVSIVENGYIVVIDNKIEGVYQSLPEEYQNEKITDYGDSLVFPSFSDMHLHAPQYPMLGMGYDLQLLEWLRTYTFPTEAKFKDSAFARKTAQRLAKDLIRNGTTRVAMFSSLHKEATLILMEELEKAGVCGYVGKVNMDRHGGENLEENTGESMVDTKDWLNQCNFPHVKPILTPRFIPSCTPELLTFLGEIAKKEGLPIQSHLSENTSEVDWVRSLENVDEYYQAYEKYGLWNSKTLMAHCVHSSEKEIRSMAENGVYVVHCPASNNNLISGCAHIRDFLNAGVKVVLGSDIAAGEFISMFDNVKETIKTSKNREIMDNWETPFLSVEEAFYLATSAANEFFSEGPGFAKGNSFHAIVLQDGDLLSPKELTVKERFERMFYIRQRHAIKAVYSDSRLVFVD
ncbi:MAG: amidohydrolase family protein [Bacilli bacterium]|nr:amidohydrolase family protein [Bacilli bacterium]